MTASQRVSAPATTEPGPRLRLGTRGSALAVIQSTTIADALRALGAEVELVTVRTLGDDRPPDTTWGEGAFVGALETALIKGDIDFAVHSAKDVPTTEHPALTIAAYPHREDPRDALVGREPGTNLEDLPLGARVGTDSPRRGAFIRTIRPDLRVHPLHGNVDTRLRRLDEGQTDALILAVAGLTRLGRADRIGQVLDADVVLPAPGQGSLAIQCRADDATTLEWLARLDDPDTRAAVEAERAFLNATGGGCRAPIGALGRVEGEDITLRAGTAGIQDPRTPAGERPAVAWGEVRGQVADRFALAAGLAARLTAELAGQSSAADAPAVLVTRPAGQSEPLAAALLARGLRPVIIPTIEIRPVEPGTELDAAVIRALGASWIVVTSANGATAALDAATRLGVSLSGRRWAAVGSGTAATLAERGIAVAFIPSSPDGKTLAAELPIEPGAPIFVPRADIADGHVAEALARRGARVDDVVAYRTVEAPEGAREQLRALFAAGDLGAIVFTSGSTVRGLTALLGSAHLCRALDTLACCIGESTATAARVAGFERVVVAPAATPDDLADLIHDALDLGRTTSTPARRREDPA
jgi:hydroxymethylbilane synthase